MALEEGPERGPPRMIVDTVACQNVWVVAVVIRRIILLADVGPAALPNQELFLAIIWRLLIDGSPNIETLLVRHLILIFVTCLTFKVVYSIFNVVFSIVVQLCVGAIRPGVAFHHSMILLP